jgi:large subunit ribosomal protein L13
VKTYSPKSSEIKREWFVVDATGQSLGRLATKVTNILRGKHKTMFTPAMDTGDFVIVINAGKITVTGNKLEDKNYYRHSQYPGGLSTISLTTMLARHPERVVELAVHGMMPKNKLGRAIFKKLKVYAGPTHPHAAQKPQPLSVTD